MKSTSALVLGSLAAFTFGAPAPKGDGSLRDNFDGKLSLEWKVVRPDATHVSLNKVKGALVITTQLGSIHGPQPAGDGGKAKNIHLIDNPFKEMDWVATTCVAGLRADTFYQQAGLIVYTDDDNYLKWGYEADWSKGEGQRFIAVAETVCKAEHVTPSSSESGLQKYWLRLTRRGDTYALDWSADGDKWVTGPEAKWGDGHPKRVGLIAKNGGNKEAAERDAAFEFFDLRPAPPVKK